MLPQFYFMDGELRVFWSDVSTVVKNSANVTAAFISYSIADRISVNRNFTTMSEVRGMPRAQINRIILIIVDESKDLK